jgi:hypothetical protein
LRKAKRHALKPAEFVKQDTIMTTMAAQAREYCEKINAIASCIGDRNLYGQECGLNDHEWQRYKLLPQWSALTTQG